MFFRSFAIFHARMQGLRNRMPLAHADAIWLFIVIGLRNTTIKILTASGENHEITSILHFGTKPSSISLYLLE
jgi:hypothetical protein